MAKSGSKEATHHPRAIACPWGVTFSHGSEASYGTVLYLRWETQDGIIVRLVKSKAKLTLLDQNGDVIKAELCGAVFATLLKRSFEKHCRNAGSTSWIARPSFELSRRTGTVLDLLCQLQWRNPEGWTSGRLEVGRGQPQHIRHHGKGGFS